MARLLNRKSTRKLVERFPLLRYLEWSVEACMLQALWLFTFAMSPQRASRLGGDILGKLGPRLQKNQHVIQNLSIVFPDKQASEIASLASGVWRNFGSVLAEFPHLDKLLEADNTPPIVIDVDPECQRIVDAGKPAIFVVPHLANWELAAGVIVKIGAPLSAIFSPQQNPLMDRMIQHKRKASNCKFFTKHSALRAMFRELNDGRFIGLLPDQRVDSGRSVPFCGVEALTTTSPARVAIRYDCPIIPVRMERLDGLQFKASFYPPIKPREQIEDIAERAFEMTVRINDLICLWIREQPEQWLCMKRRWPKIRTNRKQQDTATDPA